MTKDGKEKVLVVAFDGMDKELIERFELESVVQEEYGSVDNDSDIRFRVTSELFASFITGETWRNHGVIKLNKCDSNYLTRYLSQGLIPKYLTLNIRGFWRLNELSKRIINVFWDINDFKYTREDLKCSTIFEKLELSKPLFVPSYNPDKRWQLELPHGVMKIDGNKKDVREYSKRLTRSRLDEFYDLSFEFWDFIMLHLHEPDAVQDVELGNYRQDYERLDNIAEEIIEKFGEEWTIIFMSDHGKIEEEKREHNTNAFYSCNQEMFGDETPHITDFHDKIIELVEE